MTRVLAGDAVCTACGTVEPRPVIFGMQLARPHGWSQLALDERGRVVGQFVLCRSCTSAVRGVLAARRDGAA